MNKQQDLEAKIRSLLPELQVEKELAFGDFVTIEQKRYGVPNEHYIYKVISAGGRSNTYVEVPVQGSQEEKIHGGIVPVVRAVCCGVAERDIMKFKLEDVARNSCAPDITLEHVLRCLPNFAYSDVKGFIEFHTQPQHYTRKAVYWQLGKPLNDQSQEVIEFLYPLICTA